MATNVKFKISMDAEAKKAGEFELVEFSVDFDGVDEELIRKHAIANQIVAWQAQIRSNWDKFLKGDLPPVVKFGVPLFEGKRATVTRPPTEQEVKEFMAKKLAALTPEQLGEFVRTGKFPEELEAEEV